MGKKSRDSVERKALDLLKGLKGSIKINQNLNVNCGSCDGHKDKKDKKDDDVKGKKCECKGFTNGPVIFAEICPDCKVKESLVTIPGFFNSITVNKPDCFKVDNTEYLTTSGKGIFENRVGAYTLILAENPVGEELVSFTFVSVTDEETFVVFILAVQEVDIEDCKNKKGKESQNSLPGNLANLQNLASRAKPYAKRITIRPDGRLKEKDISDLFKRSK